MEMYVTVPAETGVLVEVWNAFARDFKVAPDLDFFILLNLFSTYSLYILLTAPSHHNPVPQSHFPLLL